MSARDVTDLLRDLMNEEHRKLGAMLLDKSDDGMAAANWQGGRVNGIGAAINALTALTSSGYRILGPDEIDAVTVAKCAEVVRKLPDRRYTVPDRRYADNVGFVTVPPNREDFASAIRALCATHQGDK